jgi:Ca2+:H+ antiporter
MAIALPAAYHYAYPSTQELVSATRAGSAPEGVELQNLLKMSRGLSFILLAVYAAFLCFQLYSGSSFSHRIRDTLRTRYKRVEASNNASRGIG